MRRDNIELPDVPDRDRPGDVWMQGPAGAVRTWNGRRRRFFSWGVLVTLVIACVTLAAVPRSAIFKPGQLSSPHAQILSGTLAKERCAACHGDLALSPVDWFAAGGDGHENVSQSERCMVCHHRTIPVNLALKAHNLEVGVRDKITQFARQAASRNNDMSTAGFRTRGRTTSVDQDNVRCALCHKEHQGPDADLLAISDAQCQTCHAQQYESFAQSHPDWKDWPYRPSWSVGEIEFNHATHQLKHFPQSKGGQKKFECSFCHADASDLSLGVVTKKGELVVSSSYEVSCKACHDESLDLQSAQGLGLVALPSLPQELVGPESAWPASATGYPDGSIPPLMELLLRSDRAVAERLRRIPEGRLSRLDPDRDSETLRVIAQSTRTLIREFAAEGHDAMIRRLSAGGISPAQASELLRSIPPQLIESAFEKWFAGSSLKRTADTNATIRRVAATDDDLISGSLLDDSLLDDSLVDDPLQQTEKLQTSDQPKQRAIDLVSQGGWYRDDTRMSIRYRGRGHIDPVMVSLIETFNQLSDADPLKKRFFVQPSVAACVSCHPGSKNVPAAWRALASIGRGKFSHGPHLNISQLGDCLHCHRVNSSASSDPDEPEFCRLSKQTCAACHRPGAAGDRCTQCHRYHMGSPLSHGTSLN